MLKRFSSLAAQSAAFAKFVDLLEQAGAWRLKSRQPLRSPPARAENESAKADFAMAGAVSTASLKPGKGKRIV